MISIIKNGEREVSSPLELRGLSTDELPTEGCYEYGALENGSTFYCMDTGDIHMYDAEHKIWVLQ